MRATQNSYPARAREYARVRGDRFPRPQMPVDLAAGLRTARREARLSQAQLAERAGISRHTIESIEQGRRRPGHRTIEGLRRVLSAELVDQLERLRRRRVRIRRVLGKLRPRLRPQPQVERTKRGGRPGRRRRWMLPARLSWAERKHSHHRRLKAGRWSHR